MEAYPGKKFLNIQAKLMLPLAITILLPLAVLLPVANNLITTCLINKLTFLMDL